ncbi:MAG: arginine--tRNA ligase [Chitinophagia bacterium]|nr:arginine--tRNA ligase [Chitinophagia bacterium]
MATLSYITSDIQAAVREKYGHELDVNDIILSPTKKEFEGDYTFVVFPLVKVLKFSPAQIAEELGQCIKANSRFVEDYNVVKGFLNLQLNQAFWQQCFEELSDEKFGQAGRNGKKMMVEFSSPNTNKPLHLGHIRNILLGWSVAQIAETRGYEVVKTQVINDRGIAVCKSMMAWKLFSGGATPESKGMKGDHFVGDYYVKFDKALQKEYAEWQDSGEADAQYDARHKDEESREGFFKRFKNDYFNLYSPIGRETKEMLLKWEEGDEETVALWKKMNNWVYSGFDKTYEALGVHFDSINYESETYLLGKESVNKGLSDGIFYRQEDGSVWVDLEDVGMDKKILLRSDGTSVYMTQDIGTAQMRYEEHAMDSMVYVVGNEQDYHFKVLFEILKRLGEPYADRLYHLSYGMVDLPSGKMKSREGTVVDADDLIKEVIDEARIASKERGAVSHLEAYKQEDIFRKIGLAALKYFIIKVNARKRMVFDPKESVDMQGTTGPYIQNAFVRIQSVLRKASQAEAVDMEGSNIYIYNEAEKELISQMIGFPEVLDEALRQYDPSHIANYAYGLAKSFHRFYHDHVIYDPENPDQSASRLELVKRISLIIEKAMSTLGIEMPDYM